jgi:hypothetical protein
MKSTNAQRTALLALMNAYEMSLRSLYGLPDGVDIATYVESGKAPDELRAEWLEFTTSPEYAELRELMAGATR